ncbi:ornithine decarboxylase antizyme [Calycina marina]|uniref:Ornithine decarboxylase antizyme n=1 Tax=Calycina marina TaxID=1763456 RepID=A0A9P8CCN0_9HELO|nr:ornithine decarboxylase antizyme [Calycina marina]
MAPSKKQSMSSSNRRGEAVGNVLASCYVVDTSMNLTGFHYSTTGAGGIGIPEACQAGPWESPPSSPPLAALTSANEIALVSRSNTRKRVDVDGKRNNSRKEGAAYTIREECERLFCETIKTVFFGEEGNMGSIGSIGMDANTQQVSSQNNYFSNGNRDVGGQGIDASLEIWDYAGGCSFRGFVGGLDEKKSVFAFFGSSIIGQDLKQGLMALLELADQVFDVQQVVICLDREIPEADAKAFMKSLAWVGFELITLDMWTGNMDLTSDKWVFLGMEV